MGNRGLQYCEQCHTHYMSHEGCDCEESKTIDAQIDEIFRKKDAAENPATEQPAYAS